MKRPLDQSLRARVLVLTVGALIALGVPGFVAEAVGGGEICARWSGDEFVLMVRDGSAETIAAVGRRILNALRSDPSSRADGPGIRITNQHRCPCRRTRRHAVAAAANIALCETKCAGRDHIALLDRERHGGDGRMKVA